MIGGSSKVKPIHFNDKCLIVSYTKYLYEIVTVFSLFITQTIVFVGLLQVFGMKNVNVNVYQNLDFIYIIPYMNSINKLYPSIRCHDFP